MVGLNLVCLAVSMTGTRYLHATFKEVEITSGLLYKQTKDYTGKDVDLRLDIYQPKGDAQKDRPALVWAHGGSLTIGTRDGGVEKAIGEGLAKRGYVVASITYRLRPDPMADFNGTMADAMGDVASALAWLRGKAPVYRVDPKRIGLGGYSAGAEMVTNLCYTPFVKGFDPKSVWAVVDVAGFNLFWGEPTAPSPPCLILHGTADEVNKISGSEELRDKLKKNGVAVELVPFEGIGHSLPVDRPEEVIQEIARFLHAHLVAK